MTANTELLQEMEEASSPKNLSARELQCVAMAAEGLCDREIGEKLNLSEKTVNEYIERAKTKFDVETRTEAVVWAIKLGLIKL